jgi:hypothetical protein
VDGGGGGMTCFLLCEDDAGVCLEPSLQDVSETEVTTPTSLRSLPGLHNGRLFLTLPK